MLKKFPRESLIEESIMIMNTLIADMENGRYNEAYQFMFQAKEALMNIQREDKEVDRCQETLVNSLVLEGTILPMRKAGIGFTVRKTQTTEPQPS